MNLNKKTKIPTMKKFLDFLTSAMDDIYLNLPDYIDKKLFYIAKVNEMIDNFMTYPYFDGQDLTRADLLTTKTCF